MLKLLQDDELGLQIDEVWFNGWPQVSASAIPAHTTTGRPGPAPGRVPDRPPPRPALEHRPSRAVRPARDSTRCCRCRAAPPCPSCARRRPSWSRLRREWDRTVTEAGFAPGDSAAVARRLEASGRYEPPEEAVRSRGGPPVRARPKLGSDRAVANGSSIAVFFEAEGRRLLLAGDAHARVMVEALRKVAERDGTERVKVDVFKLAHHGSAGNVTRDLLDLVDCDRFVVSTNGQYFNHPDVEAIELLGRPGGEVPDRLLQLRLGHHQRVDRPRRVPAHRHPGRLRPGRAPHHRGLGRTCRTAGSRSSSRRSS